MSLNSRKNSTYIIIGVAALFIGLLAWQMLEDPDAEYEAEILRFRKSKNEMFQLDEESPLSLDQKNRFTGLEYFDISRKYRVYAVYRANPKYSKVDIIRTGGDTVTYVQSGFLDFDLEGKKHSLIAYNSPDRTPKELFVMFRDASSGKSTYGGGRYIDTRLVKDRPTVLLDFNLAYNPYCVYNKDYYCPLPPQENTLSIAIEAGEKDWK